MPNDSDLIYSNDISCEFLAAIVQAFDHTYPDRYLGRTAMQKLTYFAQVLGAPIPCRFGIYTYGPYSDSVTFKVDSLLADEVIQDTSSNPNYSNYRPARNTDELLQTFAKEVDPHLPTIQLAVRELGRFEPQELELIATLHFIAQKQRHTRSQPTKATIVQEFKAIKKDKFHDDQIHECFDALVAAQLVSLNTMTA